ncbi:regulation of nuclear pre-mRNA domain-containing protein 2-like, partial [Mustelus asterias]
MAAVAAAAGGGAAAAAAAAAGGTTGTAGPSAAPSSSSPFAALEATLEKKLLSVTNTMDGIQGLSSWILDNKKHYTAIVRHWMKCMRK